MKPTFSQRWISPFLWVLGAFGAVIFGTTLFGTILFGATLQAADRIILRDLTVITDKTVVSFDEDGVKLNDGAVLTWDAIEKASIAADKQTAFDELLKSLGGDLYRLRQRLSVGDYAGLAPQAESLYPKFKTRSSETALMVCQATMWSRLATGAREMALAPYLRVFAMLRRAGDPPSLPGNRKPAVDVNTGLSQDLAPIWFHAEAARNALPDALEAVRALGGDRPPAAYIYYAALAITAGEQDKATQTLDALKNPPKPIADLRDVLLVQLEAQSGKPGPACERLQSELGELDRFSKPLALYWLGKIESSDDDAVRRQEGVLRLLRIPALYGEDQPEVASAALYQSMQALQAANNRQGAEALRRELTTSYPATHHAGLAQELSGK